MKFSQYLISNFASQMVYRYKRKTNKGDGWTEEDMQMALSKIKVDKMAIREAASKFHIPYPTLRKHFIKDSAKKVSLNNFMR